MLSSKTIGNADTEHLGELTQIPTSEYSTHTASSCRTRIKCFLHHSCTLTRTGGSVILTNKRMHALQERKTLTHECLLLCCLINQRRKQAQALKMSPKLFLPLAFHSQGLTENISLQNWLFEGGDRLGDSSTVFFQVSQVCAWILSGWQMSSICTSISWLCWQVCLHNYFFKKLLVYASWHSSSELHLYHYSLEDLTCELLHRFRVWPPPESAGALHKEKGCDKALMV